MKRLFLISFVLVGTLLLSACSIEDRVEKSAEANGLIKQSEEGKIYTNDTYGYALEVPAEIYNNCAIDEGEEAVYFNLKEGGDMIMAIMSISDAQYEEQIGTHFLDSKNGMTTYIQLPTCGTLNDEKNRSLWEKLCEQTLQIKEENFNYTNE